MKYSELEKILKKEGCYFFKNANNGHPVWISPKTGKKFRMSNHRKEEVNVKTLHSILKDAGLK